MKKTGVFIVIILLTVISCNRAKKMKDKLFPERPYEKANINKFYWADSGWDYTVIPLIKPFELSRHQGFQEWGLNTSEVPNQISDLSPISVFNVKNRYIYGYKQAVKDEEDANFDSPEKWFIIDTEKEQLLLFEKELDFKSGLKQLNLPDEYLNPDEVFEKYKEDPVLPWFPEDIKKQLAGIKGKSGE